MVSVCMECLIDRLEILLCVAFDSVLVYKQPPHLSSLQEVILCCPVDVVHVLRQTHHFSQSESSRIILLLEMPSSFTLIVTTYMVMHETLLSPKLAR